MSYRQSLRNEIAGRVPASVRPVLPLVVGLIVLLVGMQLGPYELSILTQILILAIFGMAYDLLFGYTGLLSFGHAAFFGLGTYATVYSVNEYALTLGLVFLLVTALAVVLALAMGVVALRTTGVYFAMITLAIAQLIYILTTRMGDEIGGASGLSMFGRATTVLPIDLGSDFQFFVFTLALVLLTYYMLRRLLSSPVGDVFRAIRENEQRAEMIGYNVYYYKLASLVISGVFGQFLFFASPSFLNWHVSGDVLLQTLFGGMGTLIGPILGAVFVVGIEEILSPMTDRWLLFVGVAFVLVVIFLPGGIVGAIKGED